MVSAVAADEVTDELAATASVVIAVTAVVASAGAVVASAAATVAVVSGVCLASVIRPHGATQ